MCVCKFLKQLSSNFSLVIVAFCLFQSRTKTKNFNTEEKVQRPLSSEIKIKGGNNAVAYLKVP